MKVWWKMENKKKGKILEITYYIKLVDRYFAASVLKKADNKKRWSIRKLLITRKIRFTPIMQNYIVVSKFTYFELEDNKIRFDIPGWPK